MRPRIPFPTLTLLILAGLSMLPIGCSEKKPAGPPNANSSDGAEKTAEQK